MKHESIDRYSSLDSTLHRFSPSIKFYLTLILLFILSLHLPLIVSLVIIICSLILILLSGIPLTFVIKRLILLLPFSIFVLIMHPHNTLNLFMNIIASLLITLLFLITTSLNKIFFEMRMRGVPDYFLLILGVGYRYFFLLIDITEKMFNSWKLMGGELKRLRFNSVSKIITFILFRTIKRSEAVYRTMLLSGFNNGTS